LLAAYANLLAAGLTLLATLIYVFVYTIWLKRATPQNIVIGGAAGAIPPLVGWAAVTGRLDLTAISLFLVIFLWTPPHFWALAQMVARDYREAGVPMMPVVRSDAFTKRQSFGYAIATVAVSLVPFFTGAVGPVYLAGTGIGSETERLRDWRLVTVQAGVALAEHGLHPTDVKLVVNTHLHFDHCGQNIVFRHAPFYVQRGELERARAEETAVHDWFD